MKKIIFFLILLISISCFEIVNALEISTPKITGLEYIDANSIGINYSTNNTNKDYKVQIYNMTLGKFETTTIDTANYVLKDLTTNKTYNIIMRIYYGTNVSNWSNIVSVTPKAGIPYITSITYSNKSLTLNYKANDKPKEVEIYSNELKKSYKTTNLETTTITGLTNGKIYNFIMRNCYDNGKCGSWSSSKSGIPNINPLIDSYTFKDIGENENINTTGKTYTYESTNDKVAKVNQTGTITAVNSGTATIIVKQNNSVVKNINVTVPKFNNREEALAPWRHILIDTFFHINDRKYSFTSPGKYWANKDGTWSGKTGGGSTQSCITLPTVSAKRANVLSKTAGSIWLGDGNLGKNPNKTVKSLKSNSKKVEVTYPHKTLKKLAKNNEIRYGDIVCRSGHTFVYMGKNSDGYPLTYEGGSTRNIGNNTKVIWGHNKSKTSTVKNQIKNSNAIGEKWKAGIIKDSEFTGAKARSANANKSIHIVVSLNTFKIFTTCTNGTITTSNLYQAGQDITVKYSPEEGKQLSKIKVDGKEVSISKYEKSYKFSDLDKNHTIEVTYQ